MAERRRVGNLLALDVLAALARRPMHPYEMAPALRATGRDGRTKWGSLYTVVGNLARHGLIEATGTTRRGGRPERTVYAITAAGRTELRDWVRELVGVPEREPSRFSAALSALAVLPPAEAGELLRQRVRALDAEAGELLRQRVRALDAEAGELLRQGVGALDAEAGELLRQGVGALDAEIAARGAASGLADEYDLAMCRAEARWVRSLLRRLTDPGLSGR